MLEEDIIVLVRTAHYGMLGVKRSVSECSNCIHVAHFFKIIVIPNFDLLNLVRCTETVEEVNERNSAFNSCKMSDCTEIHNFLRICFCKHCETCLTAGINVRMVAENVEGVRRNATSRYMEYAGKKLTCDLIHIGDHEEKTL